MESMVEEVYADVKILTQKALRGCGGGSGSCNDSGGVVVAGLAMEEEAMVVECTRVFGVSSQMTAERCDCDNGGMVVVMVVVVVGTDGDGIYESG